MYPNPQYLICFFLPRLHFYLNLSTKNLEITNTINNHQQRSDFLTPPLSLFSFPVHHHFFSLLVLQRKGKERSVESNRLSSSVTGTSFVFLHSIKSATNQTPPPSPPTSQPNWLIREEKQLFWQLCAISTCHFILKSTITVTCWSFLSLTCTTDRCE